MGRIKTKAVKRMSWKLVEHGQDLFSEKFEHNKKVLGRDMPSKKVRNMIAGYIARIKKQNKNILKE